MKSLGVQIELLKPFAVVRESLERLGIINHKRKEIYPSCYILHKQGKYYIIHFKNLLKLDGKFVENFTIKDYNRECSIAVLLEKWGLVKLVDHPKYDQEFIFVLPYNDREKYEIVHKYSIGTKKKDFYKEDMI